MPYCSNCGTLVSEGASFCPRCGQAQAASINATTPFRLSPNTAALLSYILGWVTGLIFFLIDKRPYVRFHAAQSIITFGGLSILRTVLGMTLGIGWWFGGPRDWGHIVFAWPTMGFIGLLSLVLWVVLMVKAYQGLKFKIPLAGDLAESLADR